MGLYAAGRRPRPRHRCDGKATEGQAEKHAGRAAAGSIILPVHKQVLVGAPRAIHNQFYPDRKFVSSSRNFVAHAAITRSHAAGARRRAARRAGGDQGRFGMHELGAQEIRAHRARPAVPFFFLVIKNNINNSNLKLKI